MAQADTKDVLWCVTAQYFHEEVKVCLFKYLFLFALLYY